MQPQIISEKKNLTHLSWSRIRHSSGTAGSFLKADSVLGGKKIYYKLSNYDSVRGVIGHECVNEVIADRLLTLLGLEHLHYQLIHADILVDDVVRETYLCASENFRERGEDKQPLDMFYETERLEGEGKLAFCNRLGWSKYIWNMFVVDYLILNRDRHGANIEVLRNKKKKTYRLAPLFDHGLSLLCTCEDDKIDSFDVLEDRPVQSYLGSRSAQHNLELIPPDELPVFQPLQLEDKVYLMDGLDGIISKKRQDKIWEMIWKRWCYYEDFCNKR